MMQKQKLRIFVILVQIAYAQAYSIALYGAFPRIIIFTTFIMKNCHYRCFFLLLDSLRCATGAATDTSEYIYIYKWSIGKYVSYRNPLFDDMYVEATVPRSFELHISCM